jgi:hypothetical protein
MKNGTSNSVPGSESSLLTHPLTSEDAAVMTAMRAMIGPYKGRLQGIAAREPFDGIMEQVTPPEGVTFHPDTVGGISGLWCRPANPPSREAILHLHGGWFNWGRPTHTGTSSGTLPQGLASRHLCPTIGLPLNTLSQPRCTTSRCATVVWSRGVGDGSLYRGIQRGEASHLFFCLLPRPLATWLL